MIQLPQAGAEWTRTGLKLRGIERAFPWQLGLKPWETPKLGASAWDFGQVDDPWPGS